MRKVLQDIPVTQTYRFVLPFLELSRSITDKYCVNAYYADKANVELTNHIFLLFEYFQDPLQDNIDSHISKSPNFFMKYHPTESLIIYCLQVPDKFKKDFEIFKQSKYSHISEVGKTAIRKWHNLTPTQDLYGVLYKTPAKKLSLEKRINVCDDGTVVSDIKLRDDDEYQDVLNPKNETFDLTEYILKQN